jgi:hypothetical protein
VASILPIDLVTLTRNIDPISIEARQTADELTALISPFGRKKWLLVKTKAGQFWIVDPDGAMKRSWNTEWQGGNIQSWVVWQLNIIAMVAEEDRSQIIVIPLDTQWEVLNQL